MTDCDAVPSYLGELEVQCVAEPRMLIGSFVVRTKLPHFLEALSFLSEGESLLEQKSSKKILHRMTVTSSRQSKD